jgi:hypothetical protein
MPVKSDVTVRKSCGGKLKSGREGMAFADQCKAAGFPGKGVGR